jgi:caspase domain-containing protein
VSPIQRTSLLALLILGLLLGCGKPATSNGAAPHAGAPASSNAKRFALLVGVNAYAVPKDLTRAVTPLEAPGNDVALMKDLLVQQYGFVDDPAHLTALIGKKATVAAIRQEFTRTLIEPARVNGKDTTVVFYFSGHGSTVADENHDEGDGIDETLVAYDSRVEGGRDIVDDEINAWFDELRQYTSNITFIFDSCHSGSAARTLSVGRQLAPNPNMKAPPAVAATGRDASNAILPRGTQYVLLSGSRANEQSHEDMITTPQGRKMYGFFTYYLVDFLRTSPSATYLQAVRSVEPAVVRLISSQHPQAEGDVNRQVFGGVADRDDPYLRVSPTGNSQEVTIEAGQTLGLRPDALIALYAPEAKKLAGERWRLANARVKTVRVSDSVAQLLETPKAPITSRAKAFVITPYSGLAAMPVFVGELIDQPTEAADRVVLTKLEKLIDENKLTTRVKSNEAWSVAVKRGCLEQPAPAGCNEQYYLISHNSNDPVTSARPEVRDSPDSVAAALAQGIAAHAKQENVRAIDNAVSSIKGKVIASLVAVTVAQDENGAPRLSGQAEVPSGSLTPVHVGEWYRIKVTNNSDQDLSVAVVALGSSGSVKVSDITPSPTGERISRGRSWSTDPFRIGPPLGLESYKVIATSLTNVNFTALEQPPPSKAADASPLEWLLNQTTNTNVRDPDGFGTLSADSWTTARIDLLIQTK